MHLFLDCEFNGWHDQGTGELISLGLVSADGKYEFYEAVGCKNPNPFVLQHVMPILGQSTIPMWELVDKLCSFLWEVNNQEEGLITIVADYPSDIELFNRILILGQGQRGPQLLLAIQQQSWRLPVQALMPPVLRHM